MKIYIQTEVSVTFCDDPRRLPSVCLGRGQYEFTSPRVELLCFVYTSRSDVCIWLQHCFLSCLCFTHDKCRVRPTVMCSAIRIFRSAVGLSICVVSLHGPTFVLFVVLILRSAVFPCTYCTLTLSRCLYVCIA